MDICLEKHPLFTKYIDPSSGAVSYILNKWIGSAQQQFYFAQPSVTSDGKYLWIQCSNPPARYITLAVISLDPDNPFVRHFPHASPDSGRPCISPKGDGVYFPSYNVLYFIDVEGNLKKVLEVPESIIAGRRFERFCSHVSISCDGRYVALDISISQKVYMAIGDLETGELKLLDKFGRHYDHAMFSPVCPDLILVDQDWWRDYHTGEYIPIDNRIWLINTAATRFEPLIPQMFYGRDGTEIAHDYWSPDGYVCWSDYYNGASECNVETREITHVWKRPICHSHCSAGREMFVGDQSPYEWSHSPCQVLFYDRETNRELPIFSAMPYNPIWADRFYHLDPHPQFCVQDSVIVSTTTVLDGRFNVAITPVEPLRALCRERGETVVAGAKKHVNTASWMDEIKTFGN